jgi:hypothetical protein
VSDGCVGNLTPELHRGFYDRVTDREAPSLLLFLELKPIVVCHASNPELKDISLSSFTNFTSKSGLVLSC